ncbi:MAG: GyrI-like domain-containing protein [Desulfofustis sp. PB-SRB1]|jgi:hypothetical protein|nr:GyrI-like domain-containing protein [Desulfofustis sp. PB-SRB1]MBM1002669.1 GyrI-like domain-containing protein [Desulfofustis sp. PB-SRB1]HBH29982.1 hypothetical protein [Desulfofustis sp.]
MEKRDLKKELKHLYKPSAREVSVVEVPPMNFLMIDGAGDPNNSETFSEAVTMLFSVSYAVKFMIKKGSLAIDYGVMPLEGLWWADDMSAFTVEDKSAWYWTLMIMQPEFVTSELIDEAMAEVEKKKKLVLDGLRFETFTQGQCAQILHIGPFSEEGPTIDKVHRFIDARGVRRGKHHEIYLSDIRKAAPANWKTVIRQPFK